jgi:hypothetical protein
MATKGKKSNIDVESLVEKVAKAVAREVAQEFLDKLGPLGYVGRGGKPQGGPEVEIDESIIPIKVQVDIDEANLEGMLSEEEQQDKGLTESKSKLAKLLKKEK